MPPSRDSFRRNRVAPIDPSILPPFASEQAASDSLATAQRSIGAISCPEARRRQGNVAEL